VNIQDDIEFALIQLKAETLNKIDMALQRIAEGNYGKCFECGDEIAEARLRALPFARFGQGDELVRQRMGLFESAGPRGGANRQAD
jgi:DnaK suppressor protein